VGQTDVGILWQRVYRLGLRKCDENSIFRHISRPLLHLSGLVSGAGRVLDRWDRKY